MSDLKTNPNYEQDSEDFAKQASVLWQRSVSDANDVIRLRLKDAASKLSELVDCGPELSEDQARAKQMEFKASAHLLKLGGLEIERHEHGGKVQFEPIKIFQEAAE